MALRIDAADTMVKSTLTKRHFVGIVAFVHITSSIAVNFPSDLIAAAILVGAIPAEFFPHLVHVTIKRLSAVKRECEIRSFEVLKVWRLIDFELV